MDYDGSMLLGNTPQMKEIRRKIKVVAPVDSTVLITGESGTGKEIVANLIHLGSRRSQEPFVRVNCAALSESVLESELFGHEKGAFTGADRTRKGRFEAVGRGTLLLDEIGELPMNIQAKLLRVLQEKEFERVGSSETIQADFRLVVSTNRDLHREVEHGRFRSDLYYRINVLLIEMPPLRERRDDIPLLIDYYRRKFNEAMRQKSPRLVDDVLDMLFRYDWPGNVRELQNVMERLVVMTEGRVVLPRDIPAEIQKSVGRREPAGIRTNRGSESLSAARKEFEKDYILKTLIDHDWNISQTACCLEIARKNLYQKMRDYEIPFH